MEINHQKIKVIYVAGVGKSGSTLVSKVLGQVDGMVDVGELINLERQAKKDGLCGCDKPLSSCEFWTAVLKNSVGNSDNLDEKKWRHLYSRYLPLLLVPGAKQNLGKYFPDLENIYRVLIDLSGADVVVDSSKSVLHSIVLSLLPGVDLHMVHLVRDARASENSMYNLKKKGLKKMQKRGPWLNSLRWVSLNYIAELLGRRLGEKYIRVRYEDFATEPQNQLQKILATLDIRQPKLEFLMDNEITLEKSHTLSGSLVRFSTGSLKLQLDEKWKTNIPAYNRRVVDLTTKWFRRRYGY